MTNQKSMKCIVSGHVQGVWYRASTKKEADALGITGWARNLDNGDVEVVACGSSEHLNRLYNWLKQGPRLAQVERVSREEIDCDTYEDFKVK